MNPLGNNLPAAIPMNPMLQNIAETVRFAQTFQSPQAFMQELYRQNPQMAQQIMQLSQTVRNPMLAAQQMMAQQGITPEQLNAALGRR
jgi:hypothetical protein